MTGVSSLNSSDIPVFFGEGLAEDNGEGVEGSSGELSTPSLTDLDLSETSAKTLGAWNWELKGAVGSAGGAPEGPLVVGGGKEFAAGHGCLVPPQVLNLFLPSGFKTDYMSTLQLTETQALALQALLYREKQLPPALQEVLAALPPSRDIEAGDYLSPETYTKRKEIEPTKFSPTTPTPTSTLPSTSASLFPSPSASTSASTSLSMSTSHSMSAPTSVFAPVSMSTSASVPTSASMSAPTSASMSVPTSVFAPVSASASAPTSKSVSVPTSKSVSVPTSTSVSAPDNPTCQYI
ncbi:hypothetical protein F5877DRAFT_79900 [Lentinula edodes]|nr:hypothetical protein F5877DRAFT_79900 [Lentinula edodes]